MRGVASGTDCPPGSKPERGLKIYLELYFEFSHIDMPNISKPNSKFLERIKRILLSGPHISGFSTSNFIMTSRGSPDLFICPTKTHGGPVNIS